MKTDKTTPHTTNYYNTFIEVAPDYELGTFQYPVAKSDKKTVALLQYEMLAKNPYQFTSDDVLFQVYADANTEGKIALIGLGTKEYDALLANKMVNKVKAMRSKRE